VSPSALSDDDRRRIRHDIRTPLTIVTGFAEILAADRAITDDDRRDYGRRILDAGQEIRAMLDVLLEEAPRGPAA
jgi:signal transduction histidine kinase